MSDPTLPLGDLFDTIVILLRDERDYLNELDRAGGNANHGEHIVYNFKLLRDTAREHEGQEASELLRFAAERLSAEGMGATAPIYAAGLRDAAQTVQGQTGLGRGQAMPFLRAWLAGMRRQSEAQPGEGTMMDALIPGVSRYVQGGENGASHSRAMLEGLGAAWRAATRLQRQPARYGRSRRQIAEPWLDPSAISATIVLEAYFRAIAALA